MVRTVLKREVWVVVWDRKSRGSGLMDEIVQSAEKMLSPRPFKHSALPEPSPKPWASISPPLCVRIQKYGLKIT
jgi:hypothetical protein